MTAKFDLIARALRASRPFRNDFISYNQWQYSVRHIVNEIALRNQKFNQDRFKQLAGYEE